tara:strand:+ start:24277 stop:25377 length:1101 start_codon:yes stop_codon:yes gene_type:complete
MIVKGEYDKKFSSVINLFENQVSGNKSGAAFAVYKNGEAIIDVFGGFQNFSTKTLWSKDTVVNVHSTGKGIAIFCLAILIENKQLNLNAYISEYWPEFKHNIKVKTLLSHQAGLYGWRKKMKAEDLLDSDLCSNLIAKQKPFNKPNDETCYHAMTIGYAINKIFKNINGCTIGEFINQFFYEQRNINCFIGVPDKILKKISRTSSIRSKGLPIAKDIYTSRAFLNPKINIKTTNTNSWAQAEIPALNCHSNASSLARIYDMFINGDYTKKIISKNTLKKILNVESKKMDFVLRVPIKWSSAGFILDGGKLFGKSKNAFGHTGSGGSVAFADPDANLSFSYTPSLLSENLMFDNRAMELIEKTYNLI